MVPEERITAIRSKAAGIPCVAALGLELVEFDLGSCRLTAVHDHRFDGTLPGFHGGMLANVADCVAWFAIVTHTGPDETLVTTDLHIRYLNACLSDVTATARVIKLGRTLCPVAVDLFDAEGRPVATGTVTYMRVDQLRAGGPTPSPPSRAP